MRHFSCGFQVVFKLGSPIHFTYERLPKPIISYVQLRKLEDSGSLGVCFSVATFDFGPSLRGGRAVSFYNFLPIVPQKFRRRISVELWIRVFFPMKNTWIYNWSTGFSPKRGKAPASEIKAFSEPVVFFDSLKKGVG